MNIWFFLFVALLLTNIAFFAVRFWTFRRVFKPNIAGINANSMLKKKLQG